MESGKLVGRKGTKSDVRLPGLRYSTKYDLTARDLGQHTPSQGFHLLQERLWQHSLARTAAKKDLSGAKDGSDDWRLLQVQVVRGRQRDFGWSSHIDMATLRHIVHRHESIEERIGIVAGRCLRMSVLEPCRADVCRVRGDGNSEHASEPPTGSPHAPCRVHNYPRGTLDVWNN